MSDYIYGSSLKAAKSKANYLFEGDFRRRPNQNLSGASRSLARGELLQQAAEQRQNREDTRRKERACIKLQSVWRGYSCRKPLRASMIQTFDSMMEKHSQSDRGCALDELEFDLALRQFILFFHTRDDTDRFALLIDILLQNKDQILAWKEKKNQLWSCRISRLLRMNLSILRNSKMESSSRYLSFLEDYTQVPECINQGQALKIWKTLVEDDLFAIMRRLVSRTNSLNQRDANDKRQKLFGIVRRVLDLESSSDVSAEQIKSQMTCSFFTSFLRGPLDDTLDNNYLSELANSRPTGLKPRYLLRAFNHLEQPMVSSNSSSTSLDPSEVAKCEEGIWLCYSFVRTVHSQLSELEEGEKIDYINTLSILLEPAERITNLSLMHAANNQNDDGEELSDEVSPSYMNSLQEVNQYNKQINIVISQIIRIINEQIHVNALKSIIFNSELLQARVQSSIIRICNVMLNHEPLAIFNCRLLYTVAFSREFSKSLWKSIITSANTSLFGASSFIYQQIICGAQISDNSWARILPQLRLFCSLYSYLLPTLDDEEFYTSSDETSFLKNTGNSSGRNDNTTSSSGSHKAFLVDKDLVGISAKLRDLCIGFIENLYQDNRHAWHHPNQPGCNDTARRNGMLSFEIKQCFKALVRLIGQMHARDSRKQFCPDGHWIYPHMSIPANKEINFQLVTSQKGRLINHMTQNDNEIVLPVAANEIKMILILQEIPFVVSFQDRVQIFQQLLSKEKLVHQSEGYHFALPGSAIQIQARRNYIYEDAFEKLSLENEPNLKLPLKVSLINAVGAEEAGVDGGGLTKEFLGELLKAGFDPMRGFFKSTKDNLLYPNPSANILFATIPGGYEVHYEFLGRILGKAIFEKMMVELPLAGFFLAKLLARKHSSDVDLHNLASLDPVLYKNLVYLKNYKGDVSDLNLDFTISNNDLDEHEVVELKPNGSKIPVTHENKIEYVHLVADYRLNKQIRAQCAAFKKGLSQLIDLDWLRMFDPRELQILISGAPTLIDIDDWRRHTLYANGYADDCEVVKTFWRVAKSFDEDKKRKLLKFATSCSLPPLLGFKDLVPQFTIAPSEGTRLPTASTCMNLLKLPECEDEQTMKSKLLYAIESNSGFELS